MIQLNFTRTRPPGKPVCDPGFLELVVGSKERGLDLRTATHLCELGSEATVERRVGDESLATLERAHDLLIHGIWNAVREVDGVFGLLESFNDKFRDDSEVSAGA